jgi:alkanesulfonate monooxygenase SsuD/methylene tetrahydromethanopterin reductase-like flavin-dependent oxidoreductase (luciferase family)
MKVDTPRVGIAFSGGPTPGEIVDCVKLAERLGYESAWVAEGHGGDQFAVLAACAIQTSRILLGTSITSVFVRTAPTIAMAAATLDELTGGRFILGVGSSHKVQVEAEHGMAYGKPLTRVRETVEVIRRLLQEGRVSYQGETVRIQSFDLWFTPRHSTIPIYASAVSQKMTALCGEIADGIILTRSTLATAAVVREQLAEGARRAGRDLDQIIVTTLLPAAVGETRREALDALRPGLAFYAGFFPRYNRMMAEHGFVEEAAASRRRMVTRRPGRIGRRSRVRSPDPPPFAPVAMHFGLGVPESVPDCVERGTHRRGNINRLGVEDDFR